VIEDPEQRVDTERRDLIDLRNARSEQDRTDTIPGLDEAASDNYILSLIDAQLLKTRLSLTLSEPRNDTMAVLLSHVASLTQLS